MIAIEQWHSWQNHQNSRNTSRTTEVGPSLYYHPLGGRLTESSITQNARTWHPSDSCHVSFMLCSYNDFNMSWSHSSHLFAMTFVSSMILYVSITRIAIQSYSNHNSQIPRYLSIGWLWQTPAFRKHHCFCIVLTCLHISYIFLPCESSEEKLFFVPPSPSRRVFRSFFTRIWVSYAWLSRTSLHR